MLKGERQGCVVGSLNSSDRIVYFGRPRLAKQTLIGFKLRYCIPKPVMGNASKRLTEHYLITKLDLILFVLINTLGS